MKFQLRIEGRAAVHRDDAEADAAWAASAPMSRECYRASFGPSMPIRDPSEVAPLDGDGRDHFAILLVRVEVIESLELAAWGHRRARSRIGEGGMLEATWLAP